MAFVLSQILLLLSFTSTNMLNCLSLFPNLNGHDGSILTNVVVRCSLKFGSPEKESRPHGFVRVIDEALSAILFSSIVQNTESFFFLVSFAID